MSGWRVEEATLERDRGPVRLIRVTHNGSPAGWGSKGLPRGCYATVEDVRREIPELSWDELEEQLPDDPQCE